MRISQEKVWMKYYSQEVKALTLPKTTVYSYLKEENKDRPDGPALYYYGTKITFRNLVDRIEECAKAFAAIGVKQGDIVSFVAVAVPECITAVYALNKLGATANTIDPRMDKDSIQRMIRESESRVLLVLDMAFPKIRPYLDKMKQEHIIVLSPGDSMPFIMKTALKLKSKNDIPYSDNIVNWKKFIKGGKDTVAVEAPYRGDAVVAIAYTGGTTGFPKGVMMTNDSMNAVAVNFKYCGLDYTPDDRFLGIIPIFSAYGMVCGLHMPLCLNMEVIPVPRFVPIEFGKLIKKYRPQHMVSTPAFYEMLMESKEVQDMDLSFLITLGSGGDTMNSGLEHKLHKFMKAHRIKYPLAQGYGMSELSAAASFCVNNIYKKGSVGIPSLTTTVSIFDPETGEEMGYGEEGEICVTGPSMMKGYFKRPEETEHVMRLHDDGQVWIHSGDIGYMDEDGFLFVKGRVKRMITRFDGHKVFPVNIESRVGKHKAVRNCAVIGVNDRERSQGQYPLVLVEFMEGVDAKATCKEIFDICNDRLEERGRPVAVISIDEIPLTGMGKNDYRTLEKQYRHFDYLSWNPMAD